MSWDWTSESDGRVSVWVDGIGWTDPWEDYEEEE